MPLAHLSLNWLTTWQSVLETQNARFLFPSPNMIGQFTMAVRFDDGDTDMTSAAPESSPLYSDAGGQPWRWFQPTPIALIPCEGPEVTVRL